MSRIIIENKHLDGIPVNEYFLENETHKGLVIMQHGYRSNKERGGDYLAVQIAREGFFVVTVDAYMHGERIQEPFISGQEKDRLYHVPNIIENTALDIILLHEKHYNNFPTFDLIGVSLGGMIAFYAATKTKQICKLIPTISTPNVLKQARHILTVNGIDPDMYFTKESLKKLNSVNPINDVENMSFDKALILTGINDQVVPLEEVKTFYRKHKEFDMTYREYDSIHTVGKEMQRDIIEFLKKQNR